MKLSGNLTGVDRVVPRSLGDIMLCPACAGKLSLEQGNFECEKCNQCFPVTQRIPRVFLPTVPVAAGKDVTEDIKAFYEDAPFPNYDDLETTADLVESARSGVFVHMLNQQLPTNSLVLECGCGTGQLTNFLSIANRSVIGTDMCLNSLKLGEEFRARNRLNGAYFMQMNLFRPVFQPGTFDMVISNGVLHHTSAPKQGLDSIAKLVRPGGYIMIGLYHRLGRIPVNIKRQIFRLSRDRFLGLDARNVNRKISAQKRRAWFLDQYKNPHESQHTITEVIGWLRELNLEFVRSLPSSIPGQRLNSEVDLFEATLAGTRSENMMADLGCLVSRDREGENGFFTIIARRPG